MTLDDVHRPVRRAPLGSWLLLLAVVVTVVAWASAFIVIRGIGDAFSPGALALGRLLVGVVALSLLVVGRPWVRLTGRDWLFVSLYGVLWFGGYNVLLNLAEQSIDAGTTAMVVNIGPLLIAVGAALFLGERLHRWLVIGLALAFCGVIVIGLANSGASLDLGLGVLAALGAAVTYTAGVLLQKPTIGRIPSRQVTFLGALVGALACLPFTGQLFQQLGDATAASIAGLVYLGVVPTAIAFTTWGFALGRMPASQLGITTYLVPPLVIVAAVLFFGEFPVPVAILGGVLCLAGVAVSRRSPRPRVDSAAPGTIRDER